MFVNICTTSSPYSLIIKTIYRFSDQYHRITESLLQSMKCCRLCALLWMAIWNDNSNPWEICGSAGTAKSADTFLQSFGKWCDPKTIHQIWSVHFDIILMNFLDVEKNRFIQTIPSKPKKKPTLQGGNRGHERRSHKTLEQWHGQVSKEPAPPISLVCWGSGWWWCLEGS